MDENLRLAPRLGCLKLDRTGGRSVCTSETYPVRCSGTNIPLAFGTYLSPWGEPRTHTDLRLWYVGSVIAFGCSSFRQDTL